MFVQLVVLVVGKEVVVMVDLGWHMETQRHSRKSAQLNQTSHFCSPPLFQVYPIVVRKGNAFDAMPDLPSRQPLSLNGSDLKKRKKKKLLNVAVDDMFPQNKFGRRLIPLRISHQHTDVSSVQGLRALQGWYPTQTVQAEHPIHAAGCHQSQCQRIQMCEEELEEKKDSYWVKKQRVSHGVFLL